MIQKIVQAALGIFRHRISLFFVVPFLLTTFGFVAYAAEYVRVNTGQTSFVYELPQDVRNDCGVDIFVPLKSAAERASFTSNKPSCIRYGWSQTFPFSGSGSQSFSFALPFLEGSGLSQQYSGSNVFGAVPGSVGFGSAFVNQPQYNSVSVSANSSYPVDVTCVAYGGYYLDQCIGYGPTNVTVNGQTYPVNAYCSRYTGYYMDQCIGYVPSNVTINGQTYLINPICVAYTGYYMDQCMGYGGNLDASFSGTVTVSGTRSMIIRTTIGPISGNGSSISGTFLCPSGTFVYGFNVDTGQRVRNDGPHIVIREVYCAESRGATTDTITRTISLFPETGGTCAQDEYIKGFRSSAYQAGGFPYSIVDALYCARLTSPSAQATADSFNMLTYNNGNPYSFSARTGVGGGPRAIVGITANTGMGPGGANGPRSEPNYYFSRSMPSQ